MNAGWPWTSERGKIRFGDPLGNLDRHGGTGSGQRASGNDPHSTSGRTARKSEYDPGQRSGFILDQSFKPEAAAFLRKAVSLT